MNKIVNLKTEDIIQVEDKNFHYEYIIHENDAGIIFMQTLKTRMPKPITPRNPKNRRKTAYELIEETNKSLNQTNKSLNETRELLISFINEQRKFNTEQRKFNAEQRKFNNWVVDVFNKNNLKV